MRKVPIIVLVLVITLLSGCDPRYGIIESDFELASDSRLPRWFESAKYSRGDLTVRITLYGPIIGSDNYVVMRVYDHYPLSISKKLGQKLMTLVGKKRKHPLMEVQSYPVFPRYFIVSVDGVGEVFEQRKLEPILYVSDDPKVTAVLRNKTP